MSYWNSGPDREEDLRHSDPDDLIDPYDREVEREQIRDVNARNERYRQLAKLREEIERYRAAYERAKKASGYE